LYDCAACPVVAAQAELWPENVEAWELYQVLATRAAVEMNIGGIVLDRYLEDGSREDALALVQRLVLKA
jgi:hypothetical protein